MKNGMKILSHFINPSLRSKLRYRFMGVFWFENQVHFCVKLKKKYRSVDLIYPFIQYPLQVVENEDLNGE